MSKKKWTYEACYEEAKKYKTRGEFQKGTPSAYLAARKYSWLDDYDWLENGYSLLNKRRAIWTYEKCREIALTCKTLKDFYVNNKSAYSACYRNQWLDLFDWLERSVSPYSKKSDFVYAYFFNNNTVYIGRTIEPKKRHNRHNSDAKDIVFKFAQKNNIAVPEMTILETDLTLNDGLEKEDYYVNKYREEGWNVLNKAKTGKKSGSLGGLNATKWTYNKCYEEAKKYKTLKDFANNSPVVYGKCLKEKWLKHFDWLERQIRWTVENCLEEAKKYKTLKDFRTNSHQAYYVLLKKGKIDSLDWLIKGESRKKIVVKYTLDGKEIERYNGVGEAVKQNGYTSKSGIINCCLGIIQTCHGFKWRYEETEAA